MKAKMCFAFAVILAVVFSVALPTLAQTRANAPGGQEGYYFRPEGWARIGIDYSGDGIVDRYEYIYIPDLDQALARSAQRESGERMSQYQREVPPPSGYYMPRGTYQSGTGIGPSVPVRSMDTVTGTLRDLMQIRLAGVNQEHLIARVDTPEGRTARVDLGPVEAVSGLNLKDGDRITVAGNRGTIDDTEMLMAQRVEAAGRTVTVDLPYDRRLGRYSGEVLGIRTASFRGVNGPEHVFARVRLDRGVTTAVDLGPVNQLGNLDFNTLVGKEISFLGHPAYIRNKMALVAEELRVDGQTYTVNWPPAG